MVLDMLRCINRKGMTCKGSERLYIDFIKKKESEEMYQEEKKRERETVYKQAESNTYINGIIWYHTTVSP